MIKIRALIVLVAAALLALPAAALAQNTSTVTGTANIVPRVTLPNNAVVTVQLAELRAGAPALVIAEQTFTTNGAQAPFPFTLQYDKGRINTNSSYIVQGNIKVSGQMRYSTSTPYRVITQGNPTNVAITMNAVGTLPSASGGTGLLLGALLLGVLLLLVRQLRLRLVR
ncbi:MAG TPA: YbaY family lipoprotein [Roseiflexaceae bacterium]|nr:YbaY family lipoprotein [Roseiflexaceae bacterium]